MPEAGLPCAHAHPDDDALWTGDLRERLPGTEWYVYRDLASGGRADGGPPSAGMGRRLG